MAPCIHHGTNTEPAHFIDLVQFMDVKTCLQRLRSGLARLTNAKRPQKTTLGNSVLLGVKTANHLSVKEYNVLS
mgnify:FL=1